jgi:hypothetical protein
MNELTPEEEAQAAAILDAEKASPPAFSEDEESAARSIVNAGKVTDSPANDADARTVEAIL